MAELILSSELDSDEEMDTLMLLYQTSTRLKFGMEKRVYEKYKKSR
jgi:hypothetical protein